MLRYAGASSSAKSQIPVAAGRINREPVLRPTTVPSTATKAASSGGNGLDSETLHRPSRCIVKLLQNRHPSNPDYVVDLLIKLSAHDCFRDPNARCNLEHHCTSLVAAQEDAFVLSGVKLFATFSKYGYFSNLKLQIVLIALCRFYLPEPPLLHRGTLIQILLEDASRTTMN
ncbi:hypothetical protein BU17DRAFT_71570 [Hysterangium stoloniferum]|nr:hypothetical protein BU17DRAFT_71570 [Hysterangium stoloniferum]